jgi:hypothetical protein
MNLPGEAERKLVMQMNSSLFVNQMRKYAGNSAFVSGGFFTKAEL